MEAGIYDKWGKKIGHSYGPPKSEPPVRSSELVMPHVCRESKTCTCYQLALEPDESCPQHGAGEWPPRCAVCGHFMKWETRNVDAV